MNTTELGTLAQQVLEYMAVNDGPGLLSLSNASGTYTVIGTFTDTAFESNIGGGNTQVNSNVITIYQDLTTPSGDEPPRFFKYNTGDAPVKLSSDSEIDDLANLILTWGLTNEGPHSFVIEETTPSDGGTWSDLGSLTEIYAGELTNSKKLFKKLSSGAYTLNRPLKTGGQGILQKFNDTDINNLAKKVRERIVNTGIGTYLFQAATPSPGTWVSKGSINDTRATANPTNYQSDTPYLGTDTYTGPAPAGYTGQVDTIYSGDQYTNTYQGTYENFLAYTLTNSYETDYTNFTEYTLTLSFDQFYTNFVGYSTDYQTNYTIAYENFAIFEGGVFSTDYTTDYTQPAVYTGLTDFTNSEGAIYSGTSAFQISYDGTPYAGPIFAAYTNPSFYYTGQGGFYLGPQSNYTGSTTLINIIAEYYAGTVFYEGPQTFFNLGYTSTTAIWAEPGAPILTGPGGSLFVVYIGPGSLNYSGLAYTGVAGKNTDAFASTAYTLNAYLRETVGPPPGTFYVGPNTLYLGPKRYTGTAFYLLEYTLENYQIESTEQNYISVGFGVYTSGYLRELFYDGNRSLALGYFDGPGSLLYTGAGPEGTVPTQEYTGGGPTGSGYLGPAGVYTGTALFFRTEDLYTGSPVDGAYFVAGFSGPASYTNLYLNQYTVSYTVSTFFENFFARDYENIYNLSLLYTTTYDRDVLYSSTNLYERSFIADLLYSSSVTYEGPSFQTIYDATGNPGTLYTLEAFPVYTAILPDTGSYVNENAIPYTVDYEGLLIEDTPQTISTITLWRRVA